MLRVGAEHLRRRLLGPQLLGRQTARRPAGPEGQRRRPFWAPPRLGCVSGAARALCSLDWVTCRPGTYWGVTRSLCWVRSRARAGVCWPRAVGREGPRPAPALNPARGPGPQRVRNLTDLLFPLLFLGCQKSVCGCDSLSGKRHFARPSAPGPVGRAPPRPSSGPAGGTAAPGARPPEAAVPRGEGAPLTP